MVEKYDKQMLDRTTAILLAAEAHGGEVLDCIVHSTTTSMFTKTHALFKKDATGRLAALYSGRHNESVVEVYSMLLTAATVANAHKSVTGVMQALKTEWPTSCGKAAAKACLPPKASPEQITQWLKHVSGHSYVDAHAELQRSVPLGAVVDEILAMVDLNKDEARRSSAGDTIQPSLSSLHVASRTPLSARKTAPPQLAEVAQEQLRVAQEVSRQADDVLLNSLVKSHASKSSPSVYSRLMALVAEAVLSPQQDYRDVPRMVLAEFLPAMPTRATRAREPRPGHNDVLLALAVAEAFSCALALPEASADDWHVSTRSAMRQALDLNMLDPYLTGLCTAAADLGLASSWLSRRVLSTAVNAALDSVRQVAHARVHPVDVDTVANVAIVVRLAREKLGADALSTAGVDLALQNVATRFLQNVVALADGACLYDAIACLAHCPARAHHSTAEILQLLCPDALAERARYFGQRTSMTLARAGDAVTTTLQLNTATQQLVGPSLSACMREQLVLEVTRAKQRSSHLVVLPYGTSDLESLALQLWRAEALDELANGLSWNANAQDTRVRQVLEVLTVEQVGRFPAVEWPPPLNGPAANDTLRRRDAVQTWAAPIVGDLRRRTLNAVISRCEQLGQLLNYRKPDFERLWAATDVGPALLPLAWADMLADDTATGLWLLANNITADRLGTAAYPADMLLRLEHSTRMLRAASRGALTWASTLLGVAACLEAKDQQQPSETKHGLLEARHVRDLAASAPPIWPRGNSMPLSAPDEAARWWQRQVHEAVVDRSQTLSLGDVFSPALWAAAMEREDIMLRTSFDSEPAAAALGLVANDVLLNRVHDWLSEGLNTSTFRQFFLVSQSTEKLTGNVATTFKAFRLLCEVASVEGVRHFKSMELVDKMLSIGVAVGLAGIHALRHKELEDVGFAVGSTDARQRQQENEEFLALALLAWDPTGRPKERHAVTVEFNIERQDSQTAAAGSSGESLVTGLLCDFNVVSYADHGVRLILSRTSLEAALPRINERASHIDDDLPLPAGDALLRMAKLVETLANEHAVGFAAATKLIFAPLRVNKSVLEKLEAALTSYLDIWRGIVAQLSPTQPFQATSRIREGRLAAACLGFCRLAELEHALQPKSPYQSRLAWFFDRSHAAVDYPRGQAAEAIQALLQEDNFQAVALQRVLRAKLTHLDKVCARRLSPGLELTRQAFISDPGREDGSVHLLDGGSGLTAAVWLLLEARELPVPTCHSGDVKVRAQLAVVDRLARCTANGGGLWPARSDVLDCSSLERAGALSELRRFMAWLSLAPSHNGTAASPSSVPVPLAVLLFPESLADDLQVQLATLLTRMQGQREERSNVHQGRRLVVVSLATLAGRQRLPDSVKACTLQLQLALGRLAGKNVLSMPLPGQQALETCLASMAKCRGLRLEVISEGAWGSVRGGKSARACHRAFAGTHVPLQAQRPLRLSSTRSLDAFLRPFLLHPHSHMWLETPCPPQTHVVAETPPLELVILQLLAYGMVRAEDGCTTWAPQGDLQVVLEMHLPYDAEQAQTPHAVLCDRLPLTAACAEAAPLHHDAVAADIGLQDNLLLSSLPHTLPELRAKNNTAAPSWLTAAQHCWPGFSVDASRSLQVAQNHARLAFWLFGAAVKPPPDAAAAADLEAASHLLSLPLNELTSTLLLGWLTGADCTPPSLKDVQFLSLPSLARAADRQWPFVRLVRSSALAETPTEEQLAFLRCAEQAGRAVGGSFSLAAVQALVAAVEGMFGTGVVDAATAAEPDFVLSPHVLLRLLVLGVHFALGLPLVLEGETGVGKTKLLQVFFHCFVLHDRTSDAGQLKQINVHPGLEEDIVARLLAESLEGCTTAKPSGPEATPTWLTPPNVLLFVDEINCAPVSVMETLRSLVMDRHFTTESGVRQRLTARVWVAAACNPAGLSRRALYYVQPMPPSLERVRWPLDSLAMDDVAYIAAVRLFRWLALCLVAPDSTPSQSVLVMCTGDEEQEVVVLLSMILAAHRAADAFGSRQRRAGEAGAPAVSLRDLDRTLELATAMLDSMLQLPFTPFWPERAEMLGAGTDQARATRERAIGLGVAMAFMLRMPRSRRQSEAGRSGSPRLEAALQWMDLAAASLVQLLKLEERQAALPFDGLNETLLALFVYTSARIPLFIIGEPGTSKSLSLSLLAQALLDDTLREGSAFLQAAPKPNMTVVQCSPELTAGLLKADFARARRWIESGEVPLLVLEEAGSATTDGPAVTDQLPAIKALHDEVDRELQKPQARRVVLISISNTYFDAAKMNRGGVLLREGLHESDRVELALTSLRRAAERVSSAFTEPVAVETVEATITELAHNLAKPIYHALGASVRHTPLAATFGHRDYFAILQTVIHTAHNLTVDANGGLSRTPSQRSLSHSAGPAVEESVEDVACKLRLGLRQSVAMAVLQVADGVHAARTQVIDTMRQLWEKDGLPLATTQVSSLPEGARAGQLLQRAMRNPSLWATSGDKSETAGGSDARQSSSSAADAHDGRSASERGKSHRDGGGGDIVYLDRPTLCVSTLAPQVWWLQLVSDTDHMQQTLQGAELTDLPIQLPFLHNLHAPDVDADAILSLLAPALGLGGPIVVGAGPATLNSLLDVINGHAISSDAVTGHRQSRIAKRGLSIYQSIHPSSRLIFMVDGATLPSWPRPVTQRLFKVNLNVAAFASHIFHVVWTRGGKDDDYEGKPSSAWLNDIREELKHAGATGICFADADVLVLAMCAEVIQAPDRQPWSRQYGSLQAFRHIMSDHLRHFSLAPDSAGSCLCAALVDGDQLTDGTAPHVVHNLNVLHRVMKHFDSAMATAARLEALLQGAAPQLENSALRQLGATQLGVDGAAVSGFGPAEVENVLSHVVDKLAQLQYGLLAVELDGSRYSIQQLSRVMALLADCQKLNCWSGQVHMVVYSPLDVDDPFEGPLNLVPGWRVHACSGLTSAAPMKHCGASVLDAASGQTQLDETEKNSVQLALGLQLHGFRCLHGLVSLARRHIRADGVELVCWQSSTLSPTLIQLLSSITQTDATAAAKVIHPSLAQGTVFIPLATLRAYAAAAGAGSSPIQSASLLTDGATSSSRAPAVAFMSAALPQATANMARVWLEEQYPQCRITLKAAGGDEMGQQASFVELRPPLACRPEDEKAMAVAVRELRLGYCHFSFTPTQAQVLESDAMLRQRCAIIAFGAQYTETARCDLPTLVRFWCEHHYVPVTPLFNSKGWKLECLSHTLQTRALAGLEKLAELVMVKSCEHSLSKLVAAAVVKDSLCPAPRREQFAATALKCIRRAFSAVLSGQPAAATMAGEPWSEMGADARLLLSPTDVDTETNKSGRDGGIVNMGTEPGDNGGDGSAQGFAAPQTKLQQRGVQPTFRARLNAPESDNTCAIELEAMVIDMKHAEEKLRRAVSTAVARVRLWFVSVYPGALANNDRAEGVALWCDSRPSGRGLIARKQADPRFARQAFAQAEACAGLVAADRREDAERLAVSHGLSCELVDGDTIVVKVKSSNHTAIFTVPDVDDDTNVGAGAAGAAEAPVELDEEQHVWMVATEHGAQMQLQHWSLAECVVCFRDDVPITEGLWCGGQNNVAEVPNGDELPALRHFHCKGCLAGIINTAIAPENTVSGIYYTCCALECDFRFELGMLSPKIPLDVYRRAAAAEAKELDTKIAIKYQDQLERDLKKRVAEELKRLTLLDEGQRKILEHRHFVCENLLNDRCPRCQKVFIDQDGCLALYCGCGCGFCGYCLKDCGSDAHAHVRSCTYMASRGYFNNFQAVQAQRRTKRLAEYFSRITDKKEHNNLLTELAKDVQGMSVSLPPQR